MSDDLDASEALKAVQTQLYEGRFADALTALAHILAGSPDHVDAQYMQAVCLRYLKRYDEAKSALERLNDLAPEFGRGLQEQAHLLRDMGDLDAALAAYHRATRANPALHAAWAEQAKLLERKGDRQGATQAKLQADTLRHLPKELLAASNHLYENRLLKAEALCRAFLQQNPKHVEGMRLLAEIGNQLGVLEDAEFLLESAVAFEPDNIPARIDYIKILRKRQKFERALEQARYLHNLAPENPVFTSQLAIEEMQAGHTEAALGLFDDVLKIVPNDPATLTSRGHALKTFGQTDAAIASYQKAHEANPEHGEAYYSLANLKTYTFTDHEFTRMQQLEADTSLSLQDSIYLGFALAKAYEDHGDYAAAFAAYERGNELKRKETRYTSEQMEEEFAAQKEFCTEQLFERQGGKGDPSPDPIFIVGLPRAGSTLLEQILASHSQVEGTRELPNIIAISQKLRGRQKLSDRTRYPRILHELEAAQFAELGRQYLKETRIHRSGKPFFTDKMPNNFRHVGLIHLILPDAKIIDARREPMACCFSGFKQLFAEGQEFTYGLEEIGRYYRGYVDLMAHWDRVLPGKILRVQYEDVVTDLENQVRRLLEFCNLPFEEACLDFHKTERSVRTASSEQVRQPLYSSGVDQWRHFEQHLEPLKTALGPALTEYQK